MAEAISLAKELNDLGALANAIFNSGVLAYYERDVSHAERSASDVIELSTSHNLPFWLILASILRGWVHSVSGDAVEGISWIEQGIKDYRAPGSTLGLPFFLGMKAEALFTAKRNSEALETELQDGTLMRVEADMEFRIYCEDVEGCPIGTVSLKDPEQ